MKALIFNFRRIKGKKDASKEYVSFHMLDVENNVFYQDMFSDVSEIRIPDGILPTSDECQKNFPRIANVEFEIRQYVNNGRPAYRPAVKAIFDWKFVDLRNMK